MSRVSIADILGLLGDGLGDRLPQNKQRFRRFLLQDKWLPSDFRPWISECLARGSSRNQQFFYALQDIIVAIGAHLGMQVDFGPYSASDVEISYDGCWSSADAIILVEVKARPWPVANVSQLGAYMDRYALRYELSPNRVFGLFAVGHGDFQPLADQIKGSAYRHRVKVATFEDLLRLWQLKIDLSYSAGEVRAGKLVQQLLLPFESVALGPLLDIITEVARREGTAIAEGAEEGLDQPWTKSELFQVLERCHPAQKVLLAALADAEGEELPGRELMHRMRLLAKQHPNLLKPSTITNTQFAAALSHFARLRRERGKQPIVERTPRGYKISDAYRDWVSEWVRRRGLWPDQEPPLSGLEEDTEGPHV